MLDERRAKNYCKDDISKIENYDLAKNDKENSWVCHHRLEITLNGEYAISPADLRRHGMYYNRPYFELIFLSRSEHAKLHNKANPNFCKSMKGKTSHLKGRKLSEEHKIKLRAARKGRQPCKGKHLSDEAKKKIGEKIKIARKNKFWSTKKKDG